MFFRPLATTAAGYCFFRYRTSPDVIGQQESLERVDLLAGGSSAFQVLRRRSTVQHAGRHFPRGRRRAAAADWVEANRG